MINTVIFDLDDTLYDEIDYCKSGFAAVADFLHNANPSISEKSIFNELWNQFQNKNRTRTFNAALESFNLPCGDNLIKQLVSVYRDHQPNITLPQETRTILDDLKASYTLALLTDGFLPAQKLKVQALGIAPYFSSVMYTEELGRKFWKPSPAGFERLLSELAVRPGQAAYVADNAAKDFIAPNQLGLTTIQILRANRIHTDRPSGPKDAPRHTITNLTQLAPLLAKL